MATFVQLDWLNNHRRADPPGDVDPVRKRIMLV